MDKDEYKARYIAIKLRAYLEKKGFLSSDPNVYAISEDSVEKIVRHLNGRLEKLETDEKSYIRRTSEKEFIIYYKDLSDYMTIFHELGHVFLNWDEMKDGRKIACDNTHPSDIEAWLFARTLAMPRDQFGALAVKKNYDVQAMADEYKVKYFPVMLRGKDLLIWE